jgi:hypothetical protein
MRGRIIPMTVSRLSLFVFIISAAAFACRSPKPVDVMTMAPVCDSTPAQPDPNETGPTLPSFGAAGLNHAALIGTVEEAVSRHPLPGGVIDLSPADSAGGNGASRRRTYADQFARFILDSIAPGTYLIKARFFGHRPVERRAVLLPSTVDTLRFSLDRFSCVGY